MGRSVKIVVAEPSLIIRSGMLAVLKRIDALDIQIEEVSEVSNLPSLLRWHKPDILIINPSLTAHFSLSQIKAEVEPETLRCVALSNTLVDEAVTKLYDATISLYDSAEQINDKITRLAGADEKTKEPTANALSSREKEIVVGVVKGLTNKQIADTLCISTHTVITHRRNIASKLQIHSAAGLTIYAIVNKLVEFDEISSLISRNDE